MMADKQRVPTRARVERYVLRWVACPDLGAIGRRIDAALLILVGLYVGPSVLASSAADCNSNGIPDAAEVLAGSAADFNSNGRPDECDTLIHQRFEGPDRAPTGGAQPPDPSIAVGPNHLVVVVTNEITVYDRDGNAIISNLLDDRGDPGFFEEVGATRLVFDPIAIYDQYSGRFVLVASESRFEFETVSWLNLAISRTSDPTDLTSAGWMKFRMPAPFVEGSPAWVNFPMLGMDERGIYITGNLIKGPTVYTHTAMIRVISRPMLLSGFESFREGIHYHDFVMPGAYTIIPARSYGDAPIEYLVQLDCQASAPCVTDRAILYSLLTPPTGRPSLAHAEIILPETVHGPGYGAADGYAPDGDDATGIYASDASFWNAMWRNGRLYTAHSIFPSALDQSTRIIRWYEIETAGWISGPVALAVQSGDLNLGVTLLGNPIFAYLPSIAVNQCGHMGMVLARSSIEEYPGVYVTAARREAIGGWRLPDPVPVVTGWMPTLDLKWGDYFLATLDPVDNATFWSIGEVAAPIPIRHTTWISSFSPAGDDLDANGVLDDCQDCNANGINDQLEMGSNTDCNENYILDECEIADRRGDCNTNGLIDSCEIAAGITADCNGNGVPDECDLRADYWPAADCNGNGLMDACEALIPGDYNHDFVVNLADYENLAVCLTGPGVAPAAQPSGCESQCLAAFDTDADGDVDLDDFRTFQRVFGGERMDGG